MRVVVIGASGRVSQTLIRQLKGSLDKQTYPIYHLNTHDVNVLHLEELQVELEQEDYVVYLQTSSTLPHGLLQGDTCAMYELALEYIASIVSGISVVEPHSSSTQRLLKRATSTKRAISCMFDKRNSHRPVHRVYSFQQLERVKIQSANEAIHSYARYLQRLTLGLVTVDTRSPRYDIRLLNRLPLIKMAQRVVTPTEARLSIIGGMLAGAVPSHVSQPQFIFKINQARGTLLTALIHFRPRLPWLVYRLTQAPLHQWVMRGFGRILR
ncbi:hypothetical protein [Staphylococcus pettenkoferi]|uniref:hypothetical protein n=1 Tax=Staphylococcus pettenkoferi TaxID=170573 RepID=UPI00227235B6|nr:hypothetical protein [Staphylococcus pettenkoferi]MCY1592108.1 hypothetical protein [Staphylococcus pettenkoferi]MCY1611077.1 hypothetical protein [Staphylococcus pettenkoferi]MCY1625829.1 hypothetical protein [Staphylococcus pettenkoferi]